MNYDIYLLVILLSTVIFIGFLLISRVKKTSKDRSSVITWYNQLLDQYVSIYRNVAEIYNEKIDIANKYKDEDSLKKLEKLYNDTTRTSDCIEKKLNSLKDNIADKKFAGISLNDLFNDLKLVESYISGLADIATLIRSIHPNNRGYWFNDFEFYNTETYISFAEARNSKPWKTSKFFSSCETKEDIIKKFKELAKIYHPDNTTTGNANDFRQLKSEYDEYMKLI